MTHLNELSKIYRESIAESAVPGKPAEKLKTDRAGYSIPKADQMSAAERIKKKTAAKRAALEKKHGTKPGGMDDHPEYKKKKYVDEADMKGAPSIKDAKPAKKTNVKYDPHMKVMAPQVEKEEVEQIDEIIDPKGAARMDAAKKKKKVDVFAYDRKLQAQGKLKGKKLPPAPANEALDPVGQEDGDVNNDGKKDSSDKYLMKRRKAIGRAIGKKKVGSQSEETEVDECWKTHKKVGMKMKGGKLVNDCRPKNEEVENVEELYKGKHGQSEKEYQDSRSDAGKMISGDSKGSGANYSYKAKNTGPNPAGGSKKPQGQARMGKKDRDYLAYRKASMKKEAVEVPSKDLKKLAAKAVKRVDTDADGDVDHNDKKKGPMGEFVPSSDGKKRVYSGVKEGFSNWRNDLVEVIKDEEKTIKEKSVKNKIIINPELKESVENLGGVLLEVTEFSSILEEITDAELEFLSDSMIDEIVEEVFAEALEDGDDIDVMETLLCESIEASLTLLQEDAGAEARKRLMSKSPRASKLDRIKSAVKKGAQVARKAAVKGAEVAGKAVGHAKNLAKDMGSAAKKGYKSTQSSSSSSDGGGSSSSSGGSSSGMTRPSAKKKPGMLSRIGSKLKRGLKKAVGKTARAVSRGARNVARRMGEETELQEKELSIDQQMKISRDAAAKRKPYKDGDHQRARAKMLKKPLPKDTRTDAQKMTDATGPRPGSRYRGD